MRPAALAAVGVLLGVAGLMLWRESRGAAAPAPAFLAELARVEGRLSDALGALLGLSRSGLAELKRLEGFRDTPYRDEAGHLTIGYGHRLRGGESFPLGVTEAQAEALLLADVAEAEQAVARNVTFPLSQGQHDALVSFVFNVGAQAFADSTLLRELNAGNVDAAVAQFAAWNKVTVDGRKVVSAGLTNRRAAEAALFLA